MKSILHDKSLTMQLVFVWAPGCLESAMANSELNLLLMLGVLEAWCLTQRYYLII